jgi:hypothetical protein
LLDHVGWCMSRSSLRYALLASDGGESIDQGQSAADAAALTPPKGRAISRAMR